MSAHAFSIFRPDGPGPSQPALIRLIRLIRLFFPGTKPDHPGDPTRTGLLTSPELNFPAGARKIGVVPKSSAPRLVVFSGAGLSAESGLPTFRGVSGLWEGIPISVVCDITTWEDNLEAVHDFYDARRVAGAEAQPNTAHRTIAAWQKTWPDRTVILTQNIDRLLEQAGCQDVIHLHGDIRILTCAQCGHVWELEGDRYDRKGCPSCTGTQRVKPGVVFFGEMAPRYHDLHRVVSGLRPIDTAIVVGTSGTVLPADQLFGRSRAHSILVNLEPATQMNEQAFSERHYGPATLELPLLGKSLKIRMDGGTN